MFVWFYTFGCKVNQYETELMKQQFEKNGCITVKDMGSADVIVLNSCTVTAQSDLKLRQLVHRVRRDNPSAVIAVCGCYPETCDSAAEMLPEANIIIGNKNKQLLFELVEKYVETQCRIVSISPSESIYPDFETLSGASSKTRGIIKIQDGCDRFCSYCIIPYARGRSCSKSLSKIESEAKLLATSGHKELVAVGINISDYGKGTQYDLADAIKVISESGATRVRIGSLEPEELSDDIIDRLSEISNLCPHFHLALQSGCDKTLTEMRRKYDKAKYLSIVNRLRIRFPNCAITTDIMVGFPGESDADFKESLEFVKQIAFADAHVFPYSPRIGTPAAKRDDQIPHKVKEERAAKMSECVALSAESYRKSLIGSVQQVLFEREKSPDFHQGHAANYQLVKVNHCTDTMFRELRDVRILSAENGCLFGEIV